MTLPQLFSDLTKTLGSRRRYGRRYRSEALFEKDVWRIVRRRCKRHFGSARLSRIVLTSHTGNQGPEERAAWAKFLRSKPGPDVRALGSNNRLDIVVKHPRRGSIGIEVKCLSQQRPCGEADAGARTSCPRTGKQAVNSTSDSLRGRALQAAARTAGHCTSHLRRLPHADHCRSIARRQRRPPSKGTNLLTYQRSAA
jgi:hypothetical protein